MKIIFRDVHAHHSADDLYETEDVFVPSVGDDVVLIDSSILRASGRVVNRVYHYDEKTMYIELKLE